MLILLLQSNFSSSESTEGLGEQFSKVDLLCDTFKHQLSTDRTLLSGALSSWLKSNLYFLILLFSVTIHVNFLFLTTTYKEKKTPVFIFWHPISKIPLVTVLTLLKGARHVTGRWRSDAQFCCWRSALPPPQTNSLEATLAAGGACCTQPLLCLDCSPAASTHLTLRNPPAKASSQTCTCYFTSGFMTSSEWRLPESWFIQPSFWVTHVILISLSSPSIQVFN